MLGLIDQLKQKADDSLVISCRIVQLSKNLFVSLLWTTRLLLLNVTLVFAPKKNIDHFLIRQLVVHFYVLTCVFVDLKFKKDLKGVHLEEKLCHSILKEGENSVLMLVKVSKSLLGWGDWHQSFRFQINCVRKYSFLRLGSMNYQFNSLNFESLQTTLWNTLIQKTWRHGEKYFGCRNHFFSFTCFCWLVRLNLFSKIAKVWQMR